MLIFLTLVHGLSLVALAAFAFWMQSTHASGYHDDYSWGVSGACALVFGLALLVVPLVFIIQYAVNTGVQARQIEMQYDTVLANFNVTITDTAAILSPNQNIDAALIPIQGSIEKMGVGEVVALTVTERMRIISEFNHRLTNARYWGDSAWMGAVYTAPSSHVKPLMLEGVF